MADDSTSSATGAGAQTTAPAKAAVATATGAKWTAPANVTDITLPSGRILTVENGTVTAPDDLTEGERDGLVRNRFTLA